MRNAVCGANEKLKHFMNVNVGRDYTVDHFADLRFIQPGDPSPDGRGTIQFAQGIEVGQVFKLGTVYSEKLQASFLDENGRAQPFFLWAAMALVFRGRSQQ